MRLSLELIDIVQHARPELAEIALYDTVAALNAREGAFMSYDAVFRDSAKMPSGLLTEKIIKGLQFDERDWVNNAIVESCLALNGYLSSKADKWIPVGRKPIKVLDRMWVKPSIRGILIRAGKVAPVIVVTRRSVELGFADVLPFLMRGGYEFHLRDDPNFNDLVVLDLTKAPARGEARTVGEHRLSDVGMMSLELFEHILETYGQAASLSKYGLHIPSGVSVTDLFRR